MPRNLSEEGLRSLLSAQTGLVWLDCLTITHADLAETMRLVNDKQDLVRDAGTFTAFPFEVTFAADTEEKMPEVKIKADAVDRRIITALRGLPVDDPPDIMIETVIASQPNTVEYGPLPLTVEAMAVTSASVVEITVGFNRFFLGEPFPAGRMTPSKAVDLVA